MHDSILEKAQELHKESEALEERRAFVEQHFNELSLFNKQLDSMDKPNNEILASLGKGVFVKAEVKTRDFFVDVGSGIIIKKQLMDVQKIIQEQINGLENLKAETNNRLLELQQEFEVLIRNVQNK